MKSGGRESIYFDLKYPSLSGDRGCPLSRLRPLSSAAADLTQWPSLERLLYWQFW